MQEQTHEKHRTTTCNQRIFCLPVCLSVLFCLSDCQNQNHPQVIIPCLNGLQVLCNAEAPTPGPAMTYASASPDLQTASTPLAIAALTAMGMAYGNSSRLQDR